MAISTPPIIDHGAPRALLEGLLDYAGLFPPARLALDDALEEYVRHTRESEAWMLARFVLPITLLSQLTAARMAPFSTERPLRLTLIGSGSAEECAAIRLARESFASRLSLELLECRLPLSGPVEGSILTLQERLVESALPLRVFFELPGRPAWDERLDATLAAIADANARGGWLSGFKLRCGGPAAADVPSPDAVARAVVGCREAGIALKATAGLHHPFRHIDRQSGHPVHGLLNIAAAVTLARTHNLAAERVRRIVATERPFPFYLTREQLLWEDLAATPSQIRTARTLGLIAVGTCSFDEPRDGLRRVNG